MTKKILLLSASLLAAVSLSQAQISYTDAVGDIDPGISSGGGTLDIVNMEVSHTATDLLFQLTLNGNITTTDWGNFMIGIATGVGPNTTTGNAWARPINLDSPIGGMNYWIGSWVNGGGGSQLWSYNGTGWDGPTALTAYSFTPGAQSLINYTVSRSALGLTNDTTFYFDAYSSGSGGTDSAVDALSNPNVAITGWSGPYTSNTTNGISSYAIPEPSSIALLGLGALALGGWALRRRQ